MAPVGRWGMIGASLLTFGEKRRKAEVSTPLLYYRVKRAWKGRRFDGRSAAESVNLPVPFSTLRKSSSIVAIAEMAEGFPGV